MTGIVSLLSHIRHTTISYELSEQLGKESDLQMTVVSYEDETLDDIEVDIDSDSVDIQLLGATNRFDRDAVSQLRELLHDDSIDLLHTHHNFVGSLGRFLAPRGLPIVDTEHANHRDHYSLSQNLVNSMTLWRADRVVANSQSTLNSFYFPERALIPKQNRRVIYNGIDVDRIDCVIEKTNIQRPDQPRVTTVGRLIPVKNQSLLIEAFEDVLKQVPSAELIIVGNGPEKSHLLNEIESRGLSNNVTLTGEISRSEVYTVLSQSDVFALPSWSEGFCVALVEAMASGCAPVVSDIPVLHEVADDTAVFVDPGNVDGFANSIIDLLSNDRMQNHWAKKANKRARTVFPMEKTVQAYSDLYFEVLS